jgi:hypothetical protein
MAGFDPKATPVDLDQRKWRKQTSRGLSGTIALDILALTSKPSKKTVETLFSREKQNG